LSAIAEFLVIYIYTARYLSATQCIVIGPVCV